MKVAVVWQRFLPYHAARLRAFGEALAARGASLAPVEVAGRDDAYDLPGAPPEGLGPVTRVLGAANYHGLSRREVFTHVLRSLERVAPDVVFCPATAFPEGMAGVRYRCLRGCRVAVMDDAWEGSDRRGVLTRAAKRLIHRNVDAAFVPAPSHAAYFRALGFPDERIFFGVDAVDNARFAAGADTARAEASAGRLALGLPERYFLCVSRLLSRKGVDTLLRAYAWYRSRAAEPWGLFVVGDGPERGRLERAAESLTGVRFAGARDGEELHRFYGLAGCLVAPSLSDPWALVVNEGAASALPLIVSRGCGCAATLVEEGVNGWRFNPGDAAELAGLMTRLAGLDPASRSAMGSASRRIAERCSLERFVVGALAILRVQRRAPAGAVADALTWAWRGRRQAGELSAVAGASAAAIRIRRRVLVLQQRMTGYRVPFFEQLRDRLAERGIDLSVVSGLPGSDSRDRGDAGRLTWGLEVPAWRLGRAVWLRLPAATQADQDLWILPHENSLLLGVWLLLRRRLRGSRLALWGHGRNFAERGPSGVRGALKRWTARRPDWWFAYTRLSVGEIVAAGFPAERITCVDNAIDTRTLAAERAGVSAAERAEAAGRLGLAGAAVGVFLGSLHAAKRPEFLLECASAIRRREERFALLVIGDGPCRESVRAFAHAHPWCVWTGPLHGREKAVHLSLATLMLCPGMVGLNILDAFVFGLPLVTTDCGIHSPEIAYLEPGRNGLMTGDDAESFVEGVVGLLQDEPRRLQLAVACRRDALRYTVEGMAERFAQGIVTALEASPTGGCTAREGGRAR